MTDIHSDDGRVCTVAPMLMYAGHALPSPLQLTQTTHSLRQLGPASPLTHPTMASLHATAVALGMTWIGS